MILSLDPKLLRLLATADSADSWSLEVPVLNVQLLSVLFDLAVDDRAITELESALGLGLEAGGRPRPTRRHP